MGKAPGSHGLSAVSLTWATRVLGKLSADVSPEMLEQLANTEGAAKLFAERLPGIIADAEVAIARGREDWQEERREALLVTDETSITGLDISVALFQFLRVRLSLETVGELMQLTTIPKVNQGEYASLSRRGRVAELRRILIEGGQDLVLMPEWLKNAPEASAT